MSNARFLLVAFAACTGQTPPDPGPQNLAFSSGTIFGAEHDDAFTSMAIGSNGEAYLAGTSKELLDRFYGDLVLARVDVDGTLKWVRNYGGSEDDSIPAHIDSANEGPARSVAWSTDGAVFMVGRTKSAGDQIDAAVLLKVRPDGNLAWGRIWRPHWMPQVNGSAALTGVTVVGDRVWVVGTTGGGMTSEDGMGLLMSFDATSGELVFAKGLDLHAGVNDRFFSVVANEAGDALYITGWQGQTNAGLVLKIALTGAPEIAWAARVALPEGSTIPDVDVDADENAYLAADIHGTDTSLQVIKLAPDGSLQWANAYNRGSGLATSTTHVVRVASGDILVGGRVGFPVDGAEADTRYGDASVVVLNAAGELRKDAYYFTGTDSATSTIDRVHGLAVFDGKLVVMGDIDARGDSYAGTWRTPASRGIHPVYGASSDVTLEPFNAPGMVDLAMAPRSDTEVSALAWTDVTSRMTAIAAPDAHGAPRATDAFIFRFPGIF